MSRILIVGGFTDKSTLNALEGQYIMNNDDPFHAIFSATLQGGSSMSLKFPVPKELEPYETSRDNIDRAIDYYLLARYAFIHKMHSAFMINSFWAIEHLILSILILKIDEKEDLKDIGGFHSITDYWEEAKAMLSNKMKSMSRFDDYIGKVKGYYSERYPKVATKGKLTHTGKTPRVTKGDSNNKSMRFGKVAQLSLDELDHFVNFMLHDITIFRNNCTENLEEYLDSQNNTELYRIENNYSVIYPNKIYHGEQY